MNYYDRSIFSMTGSLGKPPNLPRIFHPCRMVGNPWKTRKSPILARKFLAKNQPRKSKQSRKGRTGFCALLHAFGCFCERPCLERPCLFAILGAPERSPNLVVLNWLFAIFTQKSSFALFCALLRSFADLRLRSFAVICALLRAFACFCV